MGAWKYPQIALLVLAVIYAVREINDYWGSSTIHAAGTRQLGDCKAALWHEPLDPGASAEVRLRIGDEPCWRCLREARLRLQAADGRTGAPATFAGNRNHMSAHVAVPSDAGPRVILEVTAEGWDGRTWSTRWPIDRSPALQFRETP